jgi:hypothetical protein
MERCALILGQCGPVAWKLTKRLTLVPTTSPPLFVVPGGLALSDSEKAEALADSPEVHFQPVNDPSSPAVLRWITRRCLHTSMLAKIGRN